MKIKPCDFARIFGQQLIRVLICCFVFNYHSCGADGTISMDEGPKNRRFYQWRDRVHEFG
jgi:hypothetical protein